MTQVLFQSIFFMYVLHCQMKGKKPLKRNINKTHEIFLFLLQSHFAFRIAILINVTKDCVLFKSGFIMNAH